MKKNKKYLYLLLVLVCLTTINWGCSKEKRLKLGDLYQGGIIVYFYQLGDPNYVKGEVHGFVIAPYDIGASIPWGCEGVLIDGAEALELNNGQQNSIDIENGCNTPKIAAKLCNDLVIEGYDNWYLPGLSELRIIHQTIYNRVDLGVISYSAYWSSNQISSNEAVSASINSSSQNPVEYPTTKSTECCVRAIHTF
jgi:hypothetical protein